MIQFNPVHLAYAVMVVGMAFCFLFGKRNKREIRSAVDDFAFAFAKLSNHISPTPPNGGLIATESNNGRVQALPTEKQSGTMRSIIRRANDEESVALFAKLTKAADEVEQAAGSNKTNGKQFVEPIQELLFLTHTFLTGCENLETIDTAKKKKQFDSFLLEQVTHRMMLLKRISGGASDEYRELNTVYLKEMEEIEEKERLERKRR